ncbi:MAG TPA: hypothetical protein DCF68_08240 [Cyanothece sp. UBA12306]|nr:hypothetical protein [Cyanothece sp. UBA12306]
MIAIKSNDYLSPEEYLELERHSEIKHEYIDGKIYVMAGGTKAHNIISLNLALLLREHLRGSNCQTFMSDIRVNLSDKKRFFYPDIVVTCDDNNNPNSYEVQFPQVIVEVLSESTEQFDRGRKFQFYRTISSLQEYILVSSQQYLVECFRRTDNNLWLLETYEHLTAIAKIENLGIEAPLSMIYATLDLSGNTN